MGGNGKKAHETRRRDRALRNAEEGALRAFARAAALMTEPSTANKGEAVFWGALGVLRLAQSDPELEALARAGKILGTRRRGQAVPGPYSGT